jgi:hypothetical protein
LTADSWTAASTIPSNGDDFLDARRREVLTAAGAVAARAPRVNDRRTDPVTGGRVGFRSVVCRFVSLTLLDDLHCDRPNSVVPEQLGLPTVRQEINRRGAKR